MHVIVTSISSTPARLPPRGATARRNQNKRHMTILVPLLIQCSNHPQNTNLHQGWRINSWVQTKTDLRTYVRLTKV